MSVSLRPPQVAIEEPIDGGDETVVTTTFTWRDTPKGIFQMTLQQLAIGSRSWTTEGRGGLYSDRALDEVDFPEDKALRTLSACTPVYLDGELLVMRAS